MAARSSITPYRRAFTAAGQRMQALGESGTDRAAMSGLDPRDEAIIGHAARHLAG